MTGNVNAWRVIHSMSVFAVAALLTASAFAQQQPIVYPSGGQTPQKMQSDKFQCYEWAKGQTGFDPMAPPPVTSPQPQQQGGMLRGAAGGAALGAAVGAIAGNAGEGAAIGAASGGIFGGMMRRRSMMEQQQAAQQQAASYEQQRSYYNRAWGACMTGRGYTVAW
jgi:hypothetical protein